MKKQVAFLTIFSVFSLAACNNNSAVEGLYQKSTNTINVNNQRSDIYNGKNQLSEAQYGYDRHVKQTGSGRGLSVNPNIFNREKIADSISKLCTALPNVDDVSTLVTDEEVLIVYHTDTNNQNYTADQVKKTAFSLVPRSFQVYVSHNTALRKNVESFATMRTTNPKAEFALNKLIQDMKKSPQGEDINMKQDKNGNMITK